MFGGQCVDQGEWNMYAMLLKSTMEYFRGIKHILTMSTSSAFIALNTATLTPNSQGKSAEEIRRIFNISNNFSGEEDEIRNNTEMAAAGNN